MTKKNITIVLVITSLSVLIGGLSFYVGYQYRESKVTKSLTPESVVSTDTKLNIEDTKRRLPPGYKLYNESDLNEVAQNAIEYHVQESKAQTDTDSENYVPID
jgi:hypothetical protein